MIDLHCHLLPGVDDGPETLEESLELCRIAVEDGITHAITTPHIHPGRWNNTRSSIRQACDALRVVLIQQDIPLNLGFAAEVRVTDGIMQQIAEREIPFYGAVDGYQIMLLEFPHGRIVPGSEKLVRWLLKHRVRPMIAHPERNKQVMKDPSQLQPFIDIGCWFQVTAGSLTGRFGQSAQATAEQLLDQDVVTVVASDGHNTTARRPIIAEAYDYLGQHYGDDRARRLMLDTPALISRGQFQP
ncbi:MAG: CpsB/CapC family capsule biosynthesis tyrosine phosphatase [Pseudomonadota bacterium]